MPKLPLALLLSFALGVVSCALVGRWIWPVPAPQPTVLSFEQGRTGSAGTGQTVPSDPREGTAAHREPEAATPNADPRKWLEAWVAAGAPDEQRDEAMGMVELWSDADARAALEFVANAARFPMRLFALAVPLAKLCAKDFAFTLQWMQTHLTLDDRQNVGSEVARSVGELNPALGLELAFAPDLPVDRGTIGELITTLVRTQPAQALAYFARFSEQGRREYADALAAAWFETDREGALRWCAAERATLHGPAALKGVLEAAARTSPEQIPEIIRRLAIGPDDLAGIEFSFDTSDVALALLPHLPESSRRDAVAGVVRDELSRDPRLALQLARQSLSPESGNQVIQEAWEMWRHSDAKAALAWAGQLEDPVLRLQLLGEPADPLLKMNPAGFLAAAESAGAGAKKPEHINEAIYAVANTDPQAAAAWIDRLPGIAAPPLVTEVASDWLGRDEEAAWRWISSLGATATRDAALAGAISHFLDRQQLSQASVALSAVADPKSQTALRWRIVQTLQYRDEDAARRWLATQPISNEVRESWLAILEANR